LRSKSASFVTNDSIRIPTVRPKVSPRTSAFSRIWAIGGGKGGTGKSFIAANLGVLLAEKALSTNLVDADLGAPNLHTFLGIRSPELNLGDFLHRRDLSLNQIAQATSEPSLRLVPGPSRTLFVNNLQYFRKRKLLNHIRRLEGTITLVDIGAGTAFNTLDFFLLSDLGIVVVTPDPASIENTYHFLRSAAHRTLEVASRKLGIETILSRIIESRHGGPASIPEMLEQVADVDPGSAQILEGTLSHRKSCLIVNQTRSQSPDSVGQSICEVAGKVLGIPVQYLGEVPWDGQIVNSLKEFSPHVRLYPGSESVSALKSIADSLVRTQLQVKK
jgi:flagellar biosynthesis protein FlhG